MTKVVAAGGGGGEHNQINNLYTRIMFFFVGFAFLCVFIPPNSATSFLICIADHSKRQ